MRITKVEAILLRPKGPIDTSIGDGSQDGILVRVHTDEGITGLGEIDSSPSVAKSIIDAPPSHRSARKPSLAFGMGTCRRRWRN